MASPLHIDPRMGILSWIILGLIAGAIARAIHPGPDPGGILATLLIGVVGAFLGGWIGSALLHRPLNGFTAWSLLLASGGAFILLVVYRMANGRTRSTPRRVA